MLSGSETRLGKSPKSMWVIKARSPNSSGKPTSTLLASSQLRRARKHLMPRGISLSFSAYISMVSSAVSPLIPSGST